MADPLVTWYIPVYNGAAFLSQAIDSVLAQDFGDWECVLIDDASTDDSVGLIEQYTDPRIRLWRQPVNLNVANASNLALRVARGKYLARLDQDDIAVKERLRLQVEFMESHPEVAACGSSIEFFGDGSDVAVPPSTDALVKANLLGAFNVIANPASIVRTEFLRRHGIMNDPRFPLSCDYGMWVDCALAGGALANLIEPLTLYRVHAGQGSSDITRAQLQEGVTAARMRLLHGWFPELPHADAIAVEPLFRANSYVVLTPEHATRGVEICQRMLDGPYRGVNGEDADAVRAFIASRRDEWRQHLA